jgi:hypothetical protein
MSTKGGGVSAAADRLGQAVSAIASPPNKTAATKKTFRKLTTRWEIEDGIERYLLLDVCFLMVERLIFLRIESPLPVIR